MTTTLITGGTGRTGRRIADRPAARGLDGRNLGTTGTIERVLGRPATTFAPYARRAAAAGAWPVAVAAARS